ncbi:MAG: T9SS type A sorting domain-containing protein [bacterium]
MKTVLVTILIVAVAVSHGQTSQLTVTPASQSIEINAIASIAVRIQTTVPIRAYSIELSYNPVSMKCIFADKADFFPLGGSLLYYTIDSVNGRIRIDEALIGNGRRSGTGNLAEVRFRGIANDANAVQFITANLRDTLNQSIPSTTTGGTIRIGQPNGVRDEVHDQAQSLELICYPNPFNSSTTIEYDNDNSRVTIAIYNLVGQRVRTLNGSNHRILWDGRDETGVVASSGIYFVRLVESRRTLITKIQFIK